MVALVAGLVLAPEAQAEATSTDSPRDAGLPPSQDFSHVESAFDPATGTWSVAYTLFGAPSFEAWGNLNAQLYVGASQCSDYGAQIASFQESPSRPGDPAISGIVLPPPDRMVRPAEHLDKAFEDNTITLSMSDSSLAGATPTCVTATISHRGFLDSAGPLAFPGAPPLSESTLSVAVRSTRLTASSRGIVKVRLKPFKRDVTGVVTIRRDGRKLGSTAYRATRGVAVNVPVKLRAAARRALKRRSLRVSVTVTARSGRDVVIETVRARLRGRAGRQAQVPGPSAS